MAFDPHQLGNWHHAYLRFRRWEELPKVPPVLAGGRATEGVRGVWDKIMAYVVAQGEPKLAFACMSALTRIDPGLLI
jgi:hypothetical protein